MRTLVFGRALAIAALVATMLAWAPAAAQTVDPLTLELTSSRDLCTANTLTELSWTIAGGRPPYTLSIDGETVDAESESYRVNCGAIPADPMGPVPGTTPAKTFTATVTDSRSTPDPAMATVAVDLAPPLPAPQNVRYLSYVPEVLVNWDPVPGAGSQEPRSVHPVTGGTHRITGLVRTRALDSLKWDYEVVDHDRQSQVSLAPLAWSARRLPGSGAACTGTGDAPSLELEPGAHVCSDD